MAISRCCCRDRVLALLAAGTLAGAPAGAQSAASAAPPGPQFEIYGFAQADIGYDFRQNDPNWFDVNRPTKLPSVADEFGRDGRTFAGARQTRFGVKASAPAGDHTMSATFEFDLFGVGVDAGQTTIRPRLAYGQYGAIGAGQVWSPFMDADVFPNSLDYWGPSGMLFFRNVLVFWQPLRGDTRLTIGVERPGASGDAGRYADRVQIENVRLRFPMPDLSAEYRVSRRWGYLEGAAIVRRIDFDDLLEDQFDLSDHATGWGVSVSSNLKPSPHDVVRLQFVYGEGIENYFNDAPVDVAIRNNFTDPTTPIVGVPLPVVGLTAFVDHRWNAHWSSSAGYSRVDIDNSSGQEASAFRRGQYALANLLWTPAAPVMIGGELQWARRANFRDGFAVDDYRLQFSFKYSFAAQLGRQP